MPRISEAQLIKAKCSRCHGFAKICAEIENQNKKYWQATISRMVEKGAQLTKKEQHNVVTFLMYPQPAGKSICK